MHNPEAFRGTAAGSQAATASYARNMPMTPVEPPFKTAVTTPGASNGCASLLDVLNMKTPEFRLQMPPRSKTSDVVVPETPGTAIKNLHSYLASDKCGASQVTGERSRDNSGLTRSSSVRKECMPPALRRLREDPSLKNVQFRFSPSTSSDDDEDEGAQRDQSVAKRNLLPSLLSKEPSLSRPSAESCGSRGKTKSTSNTRRKATPRRPPRGTSLKSSTCHSDLRQKGCSSDKKNDTALQSHNSGKKNSTITVNGKQYYVFSTIGTGGTSKVYDVYDDDKHSFAVKFVSLEDADERITAMFLNEVTILKQLRNCERVVKLYDYEYCKEKKLLSLVMEKGDADLANVLQSITRANSLSPITMKFYWSEMLHAVKEIHERGIIHSDLKPANFLLVKGKVKVIDFGIADTMQADVTSVVKSSQMGTVSYMSPESITGTGEISQKTGRRELKINTKSDVWSLGCILYALVYGSPPFHSLGSVPQKLHAITSSTYSIPFPEIQDQQLLDVLQKCLQRNPKQRPTIAELLQHPYLEEEKSKAAPMKPELASLMSMIENLSPASVQRVENYVREVQEKKMPPESDHQT